MGRPRKHRQDLPERMYYEDGRYRYHPKEGKPVELGTDLVDALTAYGKIVQPPDVKVGEDTAEKSRVERLITLGDWGNEYMASEVPKKADATQVSNKAEWRKLRPAFAHLLPSEVTQQMVYRYMRQRAKKAPVRANREKALLSAMLSWIVSEGGLDRNPLFGMQRKHAGTSEYARTRLVSNKDLDLFMSCGAEKLVLYCELKDMTRLRKKDILMMKVSQLKEDFIEVRPSKTLRRHPRTGKPIGKGREITWNDDLRRVTNRLLEIKRTEERRLHKITPWLIITNRGNCYYNEKRGRAGTFEMNWKRCMARAVKKAAAQGWELEHFTEHDIRARKGGSASLLGNTEAVFRKHYDRAPEVVTPLERNQ